MNNNIESLIKMAIIKEEQAYNMYLDLLTKVEDKAVKETLVFLAEEEKKHKEILENYLKGSVVGSLALEKVIDYKIAEHTPKETITEKAEIKDIYLFAAHEELDAYNFYMTIANAHSDGEAKDLLTKIANEEMKHKEKVEYFYTNSAFPQNAGG